MRLIDSGIIDGLCGAATLLAIVACWAGIRDTFVLARIGRRWVIAGHHPYWLLFRPSLLDAYGRRVRRRLIIEHALFFTALLAVLAVGFSRGEVRAGGQPD